MKNYVIPAVIISFVGYAAYLKHQKETNPQDVPSKKEWLKRYIHKSNLSYDEKVLKGVVVDGMTDAETETIYTVIKHYPNLDNAPTDLLVEFEAIDQKYNLFS